MKLTPEEKQFFKDNKVIIQSILKKKLEDVLDDVMYNKDEEKVKVLRLWAREIKELGIALENLTDVKTINKNTGI